VQEAVKDGKVESVVMTVSGLHAAGAAVDLVPLKGAFLPLDMWAHLCSLLPAS